ncbi:MAG: glycosyltransferase, partial [Calditrichaeota bacterium]
GSTDGTLDILRRYEGRLQWRSEPDTGQANAINKGFRLSTGDIVAWLNSDDIYLPEALHHVARFFQQHPEVDVLYGDFWWIDAQGRKLLARREIPFDADILLYGLNYIGQPTVFFRRRVFDLAGYLDESLHYGLDWEYWLRIADRGGKFAHLPRFLAATRLHTTAKTVTAPAEMFAEHRAIRQKYWRKRRFDSVHLQGLYEAWLNKFYRAKRQWCKVTLRHTFDWLPASRMMK